MANLTAEELKILRDKRETTEGRRAHYLCSCGCPISADLEPCPNCESIEATQTPYGIAILEYKRAAKKSRFTPK